MDEVAGQVMRVELIQVQITQIVVGNALGKHVIDGDQDLMGDGHCRSFVPASRLEAVKLVPQIRSFGPGRGVGRFDQGGFQVQVAFGDAAALALTRRFVIAGTNPRPGSQLRNTQETLMSTPSSAMITAANV